VVVPTVSVFRLLQNGTLLASAYHFILPPMRLEEISLIRRTAFDLRHLPSRNRDALSRPEMKRG
jgi:hypothetical protein